MFFQYFLTFALSESAGEPTRSLTYEYNESSMTASVIGSTETTITNLVIPDNVEYNNKNYTVTDIQDNSFLNTEIYGNVTFPKTLISIGMYSFNGSIKDTIGIIIPDSVREIKEQAFAFTKISSVSFGNGIQSIGDVAFGLCILLKQEIIFPDSLKAVGEQAFVYDPIFGVKGGINIKSFGDFCFAGTSISYFDFPPDLTEIPAFLFAVSKLEGVITLPLYVTKIGNGSFYKTRIRDIIFPAELKEICYGAFMGCTNLSTIINIDQNLDRIGEMAFCLTGIEGIKQVFCDNISDHAFAYCTKLQGIAVIDLRISYENIKHIERGKGIFQGCTSLKSIFVVSSKIPDDFADGCSSLESVNILFYGNEEFEIGDNAFSMCISLRSVQYPISIKKIGKRAFYCCELYAGTLPLNNYTHLTEIGEEAFLGCGSLTGELVFPNSLTKIGAKAFIDCKFAGSLFIPDSIETIGDYAFFGCSEFSGVLSIGNGCKSIGESVFSHCTGLTGNINIGNKVTYIGPRAFFGCISMTGNLEIPASVKIIGDSAFTNCIKLTGSLILHDGLESIGVSAFAECVGLSGSLKLPSTLKSIGSMAFFKCIGFKDVEFGNNRAEVGFMAFSRMHNKCFSHVPDNFGKDMYDSDNFAGAMLPKSSLNMNCAVFKAVDGILVAITTICCSGGFVVAAQFVWSWLTARSANISKLIVAVKEIIADVKKEESKDENEIAEKIINKIQDRLTRESEYKKFSTTKGQAENAVSEAIDEEWPSILPEIKDNIILHSLDGIEFHQHCARCTKKSRENSNEACVLTTSTIV